MGVEFGQFNDYTEWEKRRFEEQLIAIMAGWLV